MPAPAVKMKTPTFTVITLFLVLLATPTSAFWRLLCHGTVGIGRIDPIVSPGEPSGHVHAGFGSQSFNFDSAPDNMLASNCTSCAVAEDRSLYWSPAMYFHDDEANQFTVLNTSGGMTAYYFTNDTDGPFNISAFPLGFRMIAGDSNKRNSSVCDVDKDMSAWNATDKTQDCLAAKAIGFNCLNYAPDAHTEGSLEFHYMRPKSFFDANCPQGLRAELMFPSCWNGVDHDSPDHKSHVAYPDLVKTGVCPDTHPVLLPTLFYETIWNTHDWVNFTGNFTFSNGDPTGFGYHGDFLSGWNSSFLQIAINECTNSSGLQEDCHHFTIQDDENATSCLMNVPEALRGENVSGPLHALPGNVQIQTGPGPATMHMAPSNPTSPAAPAGSSSMGPAPVMSSDQSVSTSLYQVPFTSLNQTSCSSSSDVIPAITLTATTSADSHVYTTITSAFTSNGQIMEVIILEEVVTVTVTSSSTPASAGKKRHVHKHNRAGHRLRWR